jgi:uncharacterized protein
MTDRNYSYIPAAILAAAIIITAIIIVSVWRSNYNSAQTITVTGSAKKDIISDFGILRGSISSEAYSAEAAYRLIQSQKPVLISYITSKGFSEEEIEFFAPNNYPLYEISSQGYQTGTIRGFNYNQRMQIQSADVNKIKEISLEIASLIEQGVNFNIEMPEYHYTKIADLKIEIQAEAARDAKIRAEKIAEATGKSLGPITTARMGVIQITPKLSNQVSDYGINDLSSIEKEITAVVNASFRID